MENELTIGKQNMVSLVTDNPLGDLIRPLRHEILLFDSYVAGTSYIEDETIIDELKEGDKLSLKREPENRFDSNAIAVYDAQNRRLGYIPEKDNIVFSRLMDAGKYLIASVNSISTGTVFHKIAIGIYLVDF